MRTRFASVLLPVLLLAATGSAQSCSGDTGGAVLHIHNASDIPLGIAPVDEPRFTMEASSRRTLSLNDEPDGCTDWQVTALTAEGIVVATTGAPVCDGDQWEITQEDVDAAVTSG